MNVRILIGDVRAKLKELPMNSVDCVVTSPPYWGLRNYDVEGQIGLEATLGEHLDVLVDVFREVRRVMKPTATLWLNYGDCYAATPNGKSAAEYRADGSDDRTFRDKPFSTVGAIYDPAGGRSGGGVRGHNKGNTGGTAPGRIVGTYDPNWSTPRGTFQTANRTTQRDHGGRIVAGGYLKPKDLCMIPNRLAIVLQEDGWWVRSEIIWHKPNPMPESVYDRPTTAHEKVWLLAKGEDYFYDHEAIREPVTGGTHARKAGANSRVNKDRTPLSRKGGPKVDEAVNSAVDRGRRSFFGTADDVSPFVSKQEARDERGLRVSSRMGRPPGWRTEVQPDTRNARNVWTITPKAFREAHFATFPPELARRCILAGTPATVCAACGAIIGCGGICELIGRKPGHVLDPFGGAGTVGVVARELGLDCTLIELNPKYAAMAHRRIFGIEEYA